MATLIAHAAIPLVALDSMRARGTRRRRLAWLAVLAATAPDLDVLTYVWELRTTDLYGHRGASHSLAAGALIGALCTLLGFGFPSRRRGAGGAVLRAQWLASLGFLAFAGMSHGLTDALSAGDAGVALFWPFASARCLAPVALYASCPGGPSDLFGVWGLLTVANELLYVIAPFAIVVSFTAYFRRRRDARSVDARRISLRRLAFTSLAWLVVAITARTQFPEILAPTLPRRIEPFGGEIAGDPKDIPLRDLPSQRLVTRFSELTAMGLFERPLAPEASPWSSSFFPSWFGGEAGRWSEGNARLAVRTLTGFPPPTEHEARDWVSRAATGDAAALSRIFTLAPVEKVDLALGRYDFPATAQGLAHSHNGHPRYWSGRCNGVAAASLSEPEPFRVVRVSGLSGERVEFHPNDVKSLLSVAYYEPEEKRAIGDDCTTLAFDSGAACSMNPAVLVLALLNQVGLARKTFILDALPNVARQYYVVAEARAHVTREPYSPGGAAIAESLRGRVASLVDVALDVTLSSTTLPYSAANVKDPSLPFSYRKVSVVPVRVHYDATLALDASTELLGGAWTGEPADGPDVIIEVHGGPKLDAEGRLVAADRLPWRVVRALAAASVEPGAEEPTIDLRAVCKDSECL